MMKLQKLLIWIICLGLISSCIQLQQKTKLENFKEKHQLTIQLGHTGPINSVSFTSDGKYIVSGSSDDTLKIWEIESGKEIRSFYGTYCKVDLKYLGPGISYTGGSSAWHDKMDIVNGTKCNYEELKLRYTGSEKITGFTEHRNLVNTVSFSPNGKYIVSGGLDGSLKFYDASTGQESLTFEGYSGFESSQTVKKTINIVNFSHSGKYIVSGGSLQERNNLQYGIYEDKKSLLIIWDVTTGKQVRTFPTQSKTITAVSFSPNDKYIISAENFGYKTPGELKLWKVTTGQLVRTFKGHSAIINAVSFSSNGKYIVSGGGISYDDKPGELKLWNAESGKLIRTFAIQDKNIKVVNFSPDNRYIVSAGSNYSEKIGEFKLWEVATGKLLRTFKGHSALVNVVTFSPNGKYIISGSQDQTLKLWKVVSGKPIRTFSGQASSANAVSFSPDGKYIVNIAEKIKLWEIANGKLSIFDYFPVSNRLVDLKWREKYYVQKPPAVYSPDGKYIIGAGQNNTFIMWEVATGEKKRTFKGHSDNITSLDFSPEDYKYIVSGSFDKTVKLWETFTGKEIKSLKGHSYGITSVSFNYDGTSIISKSEVGSLQIKELKRWNIASGKEYPNFAPTNARRMPGIYSWDGQKYIDAVEGIYSPDGKYVVISRSRGGFQPDTFVLGETATENIPCRLQHPGRGTYDSVGAVGFSPNGKYLIGEFSYKGYSYQLHGNRMIPIYSQNGMTYDIFIWDVASCKVIYQFRSSKQVNVVKFLIDSPDGRYIVTENENHNLTLWEVAKNLRNVTSAAYRWPPNQQAPNFKELHTFEGHTNSVSSVNFSPDSKYLITGGLDVQLILWDIGSGKKLVSIVPISNSNDYIIYTPENYYMSKNGYDAIVVALGMKGYSFEQFDLRLSRPDFVLKNLPNSDPVLIEAYYKAYQKRLQKMGFTEDMLKDDFHVPEIEIINEKYIPISTTKGNLTIKVKATDSQYKLDRINVWVNDVPVYGMAGINMRDENKQTDTREIPLRLSNGDNKIQISVLNQNGTESLKATKKVFYEGQQVKPNLHIVAIGVSQYQNATYNLNYAAKDAIDLTEIYQKKPDLYLFGKIYVHTLINEKATLENIRQLKRKLMRTKVDDRVILFFAGHGLLDIDDKSLNYYLATYDSDFDNISQNGLHYEKLEELLDGIPARQKVMFIDACHSGEVDKEEIKLARAKNTNHGKVTFRNVGKKITKKTVGLENSFDLMKQLFADLRRRSGTTVISSAGGAEYAIEGDEWKNGVFSYCLLSGLQNNTADLNQDSKVMISELQQHLLQCVLKLTEGKQQPTFRVENLTIDFQIW